jgi:hypothetical protein
MLCCSCPDGAACELAAILGCSAEFESEHSGYAARKMRSSFLTPSERPPYCTAQRMLRRNMEYVSMRFREALARLQSFRSRFERLLASARQNAANARATRVATRQSCENCSGSYLPRRKTHSGSAGISTGNGCAAASICRVDGPRGRAAA